MGYAHILKQAYYITKNHIILWFFGLFLLGGSNVGLYRFFGFGDLAPHGRRFAEIMIYYQNHPGQLALVSFGILVFSCGGILLTNWSRIMIILLTKDITEKAYYSVSINIPLSLRLLFPVVRISLFTSALVLAVALVLLAPLWILRDYLFVTNVLWMVSLILLVPLVFGLSAINIFTVFFMVLYRMPAGKAIVQATDLFVAKWTQLLALGIILLIIYCSVFAAGAGVIYVFGLIFDYFLAFAGQFQNFPISAIILVLRACFTVLLWFLFAGLNVFFNISLLLLFLDMVKPVKDPEFKEPAIAPAAA